MPSTSGRKYYTAAELENSPSRRSGIDAKREAFFRKTYCSLIQDAGMRLKLPQLSIATAMTYCHRFFAVKSMLHNDRFVMATACLFLAGKVEETPKPLREVITQCYGIRHRKEPVALERIKDKQVYEEVKEYVLTAERALLYSLGFDFVIEHPYKQLLLTVQMPGMESVRNNKTVTQVAWNFINDSLRTTLCLQYEPQEIAVATLYLSLKMNKVKLEQVEGKDWWAGLVDHNIIEAISNQVLDMYDKSMKQAADKKGKQDAAIAQQAKQDTKQPATVASPSAARPTGSNDSSATAQADKVSPASTTQGDSRPAAPAADKAPAAGPSTSRVKQEVKQEVKLEAVPSLEPGQLPEGAGMGEPSSSTPAQAQAKEEQGAGVGFKRKLSDGDCPSIANRHGEQGASAGHVKAEPGHASSGNGHAPQSHAAPHGKAPSPHIGQGSRGNGGGGPYKRPRSPMPVNMTRLESSDMFT